MADVNDIEYRMRQIRGEIATLQARPCTLERLRQFGKLDEELALLEGELAHSRGETYVRPILWPLGKFDANCDPFFLQTERSGVLGCLTREHGPDAVGLIAFPWLIGAKSTNVNNEVIHGHPLFGRGLRGYDCYICVNSSWLQELQRNHSVHSQYRPEYWETLTHFIFCFHDSMLEVIAREWKAVGVFPSVDQAWEEATRILRDQ